MADLESAEKSGSFIASAGSAKALASAGMESIDDVFELTDAKDLSKANLASWRSRLKLDLSPQGPTVYIKRYSRPPILVQLKNWLRAWGRKSCAGCEAGPIEELAAEGVKTPKILARGEQWGILFEKRSFIIIAEIRNADALERRLPPCFTEPATADSIRDRRRFIRHLAHVVRRLHESGYRHRDLYLAHIFYGDDGSLTLIDLARAFKPALTGERYRVKDIAQLHYSAPAAVFSNTDRLRFYLAYRGFDVLDRRDKAFIRKVIRKAIDMAHHDIRHGRAVPFMDATYGGPTAR